MPLITPINADEKLPCQSDIPTVSPAQSSIYLVIALLLAGTFFMQAFWGSRNMSLTWDEPSFIASGYTYLTTYNYQFNPSHPPLMRALEALPLLFMDIKASQPNDRELTVAKNPQAEYGYRFIYGNGNDPLKISTWCRLPGMIIGTGLVFAIFCWGRELYGDAPALLCTALAAFCPNLLAQAKVAHEDMGCTAFVFFSVWLYWKFLNKPSRKYIILCGLVTGLALLAKFTSLLLVPIYVLLAIAHYLETDSKKPIKEYVLKTGVILLIAMFVISLAYSLNPLNYLEGIRQIYSDLESRPTWYFLGNISTETTWYYYIVAFFIKTPLPTLLLIFIAAVISIVRPGYRKHALLVLIPVAIIIFVTCFDKGNFGIRRILPAIPFIYLFAARAVNLYNQTSRVVSAALILWSMAESIAIYPHHLSYFNIAVGGPNRAPYLLTADDSDNGQDLPALATWQKNHPEAGTLKLVYNGTANPSAYGVDATRVQFAEVDNPVPGTYAISITALVYTPWLRYAKPIGRAGYSIYIYQF